MIQIAAPSRPSIGIAPASPSTGGVGDFAQVLAGLPTAAGAMSPAPPGQGAADLAGNGLPALFLAALPATPLPQAGVSAPGAVAATAFPAAAALPPVDLAAIGDASLPGKDTAAKRPAIHSLVDTRLRLALAADTPDTPAATSAATQGDDADEGDAMATADASPPQPGCWADPAGLPLDPVRLALATAVPGDRTDADPALATTARPTPPDPIGAAAGLATAQPGTTPATDAPSRSTRPMDAASRSAAGALALAAATAAPVAPAGVTAATASPNGAGAIPSIASSPGSGGLPSGAQAVPVAIDAGSPGLSPRRPPATPPVRVSPEQQAAAPTAGTLPSAQVGTAAPAARVFAAAITAAGQQDRESATAPAPAIRRGTLADGATPAGDGASLAGVLAAAGPLGIAPPTAGERATLDLADRHWPAAMVDHIERLRDEADAGSTRIRVVPDALGGIDVSFNRRSDGAMQVTLTADQPATRVLLADAQPELARLAEARGIRLADTAPPGATGGFAGGFAGGQAGDGQQRRPQPAASPPASPPASALAPATALATTDDGELAAGRIA